jgi:branched-chain amino acid aminotransferase
MEKIEGQFYFVNERLEKTEDSAAFPVFEGQTVYELIRVQDGIALFLEDHLERFFRSAAYLDLPPDATPSDIAERIYKLTEANQVNEKNVKLILGKGTSGESLLWIFFTQSIYPLAAYYEKGIRTSLFHIERLDPNIKLVRADYQKAVLQERAEKDVYELLLVDANEEITEGSRTNVFFVKGSALYTPPAKSVLLGIVRKKVFEICEKRQIPIHELPIPVAWIDSCEGAFVSGTGNNILPISAIGEEAIPTMTNEIVQTILSDYAELVKQYKDNHGSAKK